MTRPRGNPPLRRHGRKTKEPDPLGRVMRCGYDANGCLDKVTDTLGKITQYGYDELGNERSPPGALSSGLPGPGSTISVALNYVFEFAP